MKERLLLNKADKKFVLYIDTTNAKIKIALFDDDFKILVKDEWESKQNETEILLKRIEKILKIAKVNIVEVQSILVASGPGPYTTLRIGVATANALAFALNVPVYELKENEDPRKIIRADLLSESSSFNKPLKPKYIRPPHITKKGNRSSVIASPDVFCRDAAIRLSLRGV